MSSAMTGGNPPVAANTSGSKAGAIVLVVIGSLLGLVGLAVLASGIVLAAFTSLRAEDGFYSAPRTPFSVDSYALTSPGITIAGDVPLPAQLPFDLATIRLRAASADDQKDVFVGIAPRADVERYLASVRHSEVVDLNYRPFNVEYREVPGSRAPDAPDAQTFWRQSASGPGTQEITWQPEVGNWSIVVMNADGTPGVNVQLQAGVRTDLLAPVAIGLIVGGALLFLLGIALLIPGAISLGRQAHRSRAAVASGPGGSAGPVGASGSAPPIFGAAPMSNAADAVAGAGVPAAGGGVPARRPADEPLPFEIRPYPTSLVGVLDPAVSRWLWLVKWLLAVPHYVILAFLWFALLITTIIAGVAILFTGRYPRSLFEFNVGVLRWNWRVSFYAYSALGTDQYPPFTLARTPYPADFDVAYPERLSNWLVIVKWWLFALPHLLIVGVLAGGSWAWSWWWTSWFSASWWGFWRNPVFGQPYPAGQWDSDGWGRGSSLLGLLVLVAAVILLITERYPRALFDLVMGINRWVYRVLVYVLLMRDEYPPFRLDQGPQETVTHDGDAPGARRAL